MSWQHYAYLPSCDELPSLSDGDMCRIAKEKTHYRGHIDSLPFAVWDVALTDKDVAALAMGISPLLIRPDRLVEFRPLPPFPTSDVDKQFESWMDKHDPSWIHSNTASKVFNRAIWMAGYACGRKVG